MSLIIKNLAIFAAVVIIGTGCSGIAVSPSVSPATFLLPGLGQLPVDQAPGEHLPQTIQFVQHVAQAQ